MAQQPNVCDLLYIFIKFLNELSFLLGAGISQKKWWSTHNKNKELVIKPVQLISFMLEYNLIEFYLFVYIQNLWQFYQNQKSIEILINSRSIISHSTEVFFSIPLLEILLAIGEIMNRFVNQIAQK